MFIRIEQVLGVGNGLLCRICFLVGNREAAREVLITARSKLMFITLLQRFTKMFFPGFDQLDQAVFQFYQVILHLMDLGYTQYQMQASQNRLGKKGVVFEFGGVQTLTQEILNF